jgi:hypothetical protein
LQDPILKNPITKRAGGVVQGVGPEFKPQYCKTTTTKKSKIQTKGLRHCSMVEHVSTCTGPWVQHPVPLKKKGKGREEK